MVLDSLDGDLRHLYDYHYRAQQSLYKLKIGIGSHSFEGRALNIGANTTQSYIFICSIEALAGAIRSNKVAQSSPMTWRNPLQRSGATSPTHMCNFKRRMHGGFFFYLTDWLFVQKSSIIG